jgi:hypothetical protein
VRLHRSPPIALALITRRNPSRTKAVSDATINKTPEKIKEMTATSLHENTSRRNRNANKSTNIRDDDLHIAAVTL